VVKKKIMRFPYRLKNPGIFLNFQMAVSCEKMDLEKKLAVFEKEKFDMDSKISAIIYERNSLEDELKRCSENLLITQQQLLTLQGEIELKSSSNVKSESVSILLLSIIEIVMLTQSLNFFVPVDK